MAYMYEASTYLYVVACNSIPVQMASRSSFLPRSVFVMARNLKESSVNASHPNATNHHLIKKGFKKRVFSSLVNGLPRRELRNSFSVRHGSPFTSKFGVKHCRNDFAHHFLWNDILFFTPKTPSRNGPLYLKNQPWLREPYPS